MRFIYLSEYYLVIEFMKIAKALALIILSLFSSFSSPSSRQYFQSSIRNSVLSSQSSVIRNQFIVNQYLVFQISYALIMPADLRGPIGKTHMRDVWRGRTFQATYDQAYELLQIPQLQLQFQSGSSISFHYS